MNIVRSLKMKRAAIISIIAVFKFLEKKTILKVKKKNVSLLKETVLLDYKYQSSHHF